jgi:PLP dependent protein
VSHIRQNLETIRERVERAAAASGRFPEDVRIVAISKTFSAAAVLEAIDSGHRHFGENRVQEAEPKIAAVGEVHSDVEWHLVGHLQSNKARRAAELFRMVQSVDSVKLASRLSEAALQRGMPLPVLLQVDLGHEDTKFGADTREVPEIAAAAAMLKGIRLEGLMTIPPYFDDPELVRPYFSGLRELRDSLVRQQPGCLGQGHLSMGMSHDFEAAIKEGATIVRIGTAIFGERS